MTPEEIMRRLYNAIKDCLEEIKDYSGSIYIGKSAEFSVPIRLTSSISQT